METLIMLLFMVISTNELQQTDDKYAKVVLYRNKEFFLPSFTIKINSQKSFFLSANDAIEISIPAGKATIESKQYLQEKTIFDINVEAGKTYYFRAYTDMQFGGGTLHFVKTTEQKALKEVKINKIRKIIYVE
jgi:hypothetical protein